MTGFRAIAISVFLIAIVSRLSLLPVQAIFSATPVIPQYRKGIDVEHDKRCPVTSAEYSPDGRFIITASDHVVIWDAFRGTPVRILTSDDVGNAQYSPNGEYIVTDGEDTILWNAKTGEKIRTFEGLREPNFSPDSSKLLTSDYDKASVWDVHTGGLVHIFTYEPYRLLYGATYSPDGLFIVSFHMNGFVIWNAITGERIRAIDDYDVHYAQYSPDSRFILLISDLMITIMNAQTGDLITSVHTTADWALTGKYSPTGRFITATSTERFEEGYYIDIIDTETYKFLYGLEAHPDTISSVTFSPDEKFIVTASWDGTAIVWDVAKRTPIHTLNGCQRE